MVLKIKILGKKVKVELRSSLKCVVGEDSEDNKGDRVTNVGGIPKVLIMKKQCGEI